MSEFTKKTAETCAKEAGMQYDRPSCHWIAAPGRFEGEQWYAPYFYTAWMDGDGEELFSEEEEEEPSYAAALFDLTIDECETFALAADTWVLVRQDSQGFVMVTAHKSAAEARAKFSKWIGE